MKKIVLLLFITGISGSLCAMNKRSRLNDAFNKMVAMKEAIQELPANSALNLLTYLMYFNNDQRLISAPKEFINNPEALKNFIDYYKKNGKLLMDNASAETKNALSVYLAQRVNIDQLKKPNNEDFAMTNYWISELEFQYDLLMSKRDSVRTVKKFPNNDKENLPQLTMLAEAALAQTELQQINTAMPQNVQHQHNNLVLRSMR